MNSTFMHDLYQSFTTIVYAYYDKHGRHGLPWRLSEPDGTFDPYKILLSEVMLQQTQVQRVVPKYIAFLERFPDVQALAATPLGEVLLAWQGLGYNRRAKYLWQATQAIVAKQAHFPRNRAALEQLPGIGPNTAGAILAYAYNEPAIFIETNIRTTFIHHFFQDQSAVSDKAIAQLVEQTIDTNNPRIWYWALMDYGSHLKQTVGNLTRASKAYAKQSRFAGSVRQLRGRALRLLATGPMDERQLLIELADSRAEAALRQLMTEGLLQRHDNIYTLPLA